MRNLIFIIIPITTFLFNGLISCSEKNEDSDIESAQFAARSIHIELSNHHLLNKFRLNLLEQLIPKTVQTDTVVFQGNKIITFDFGKGFGCTDGVIRRGKIQIQQIKDSINIQHYQISTTWLDSFGVYLNNNWYYLQGSSEHVFKSNGYSILKCQSILTNSKLTSTLFCDSLNFQDIWDTNVSRIVGDYNVIGKGSIDGIDFNINAQIRANENLCCMQSGLMSWNFWEYDYDPYRESIIDDWVKITKQSNEYFFHIR